MRKRRPAAFKRIDVQDARPKRDHGGIDMTMPKSAGGVRSGARALAAAGLLGLAISSLAVSSAFAEPIGMGGGSNACYIPGSNLPYLPGEKATFSLNGQPATSHTCQAYGTWTAIVVTPPRWPVTWVGTLSFSQ